MHKDTRHFGDWEHRDVHNIFGMLAVRGLACAQLCMCPTAASYLGS